MLCLSKHGFRHPVRYGPRVAVVGREQASVHIPSDAPQDRCLVRVDPTPPWVDLTHYLHVLHHLDLVAKSWIELVKLTR